MNNFLKQILLIVALAVSVASCAARDADAATGDSQSPLRTVRFSIDPEAREELAAALGRYAEQHAFAIRIGHSDPSGDHVLIQMWREDVKLIGVNPFELGEYRASFYLTGSKSVPDPVLDSLVIALGEELASVRSLSMQQ